MVRGSRAAGTRTAPPPATPGGGIAERHLGDRCPDVARGHAGAESRGHQQVRHEGGGRRLAVGAGDCHDRARPRARRAPRPPRRPPGRRLPRRVGPWCRSAGSPARPRRRPARAMRPRSWPPSSTVTPVQPAGLRHGLEGVPARRPRHRRQSRGCAQQAPPRRRCGSIPADDRTSRPIGAPGREGQRSFRVASARSAHMIPRM
jgi:hypothetical protein